MSKDEARRPAYKDVQASSNHNVSGLQTIDCMLFVEICCLILMFQALCCYHAKHCNLATCPVCLLEVHESFSCLLGAFLFKHSPEAARAKEITKSSCRYDDEKTYRKTARGKRWWKRAFNIDFFFFTVFEHRNYTDAATSATQYSRNGEQLPANA